MARPLRIVYPGADLLTPLPHSEILRPLQGGTDGTGVTTAITPLPAHRRVRKFRRLLGRSTAREGVFVLSDEAEVLAETHITYRDSSKQAVALPNW